MLATSSTVISGEQVQGYLSQAGGLGPDLAMPYWAVVVLRIGAFLLKVLAVVFLQLQLRWTVPRFRYDQIMSLGWKILLPASLINLVVTAIAMLFL
jgi:NADH-quinone oxidoreductase subunit H